MPAYPVQFAVYSEIGVGIIFHELVELHEYGQQESKRHGQRTRQPLALPHLTNIHCVSLHMA